MQRQSGSSVLRRQPAGISATSHNEPEPVPGASVAFAKHEHLEVPQMFMGQGLARDLGKTPGNMQEFCQKIAFGMSVKVWKGVWDP